MSTAEPASRVPALLVAAALVVVEGLTLLGVAVSVVVGGSSGRLLMNLPITIFFVAVGAGLLACAWGLVKVRRWARAPVVFAQLIQLGVAWSFRESTPGLSSVLAAVAAVVLFCVLTKRSTRALTADR